jgi:hypothetical protein
VVRRAKSIGLRVADIQISDAATESLKSFGSTDKIANCVMEVGGSTGWNDH